MATSQTPNVAPFDTPTPTHVFTPEGLAHNFNAGVQAGAPVSTGTEALSANAVHAIQPQAPLHTEPFAPPLTAPTASGVPLFEAAHAGHVPVDSTPPPIAPAPEATQTVVAAPAAPAAPPMASAPGPIAPTQVGPLPAYGADLRPIAATAPAAPAVPAAAMPGATPVGTTTPNSLNQPAVVRHQPSTSSQTPPVAGLTEKAVAAATTGAAAGAVAEQSIARKRLQRIVEAVARQEPQLRWAIGDREDGSTVLVTDLASGWIPPHVEIPTGVTLLTPRRRTACLEALLGDATLTATFAPGQSLPPANSAEPVAMSTRSRQAPDVVELGWDLAQATKWRDGLPRLVHTLAKAACAQTGYLDSEIDLLRKHLNAVAALVRCEYPDNIDSANVGNWQLLATIDALIERRKASASYHFAWFQALSPVSEERQTYDG